MTPTLALFTYANKCLLIQRAGSHCLSQSSHPSPSTTPTCTLAKIYLITALLCFSYFLLFASPTPSPAHAWSQHSKQVNSITWGSVVPPCVRSGTPRPPSATHNHIAPPEAYTAGEPLTSPDLSLYMDVHTPCKLVLCWCLCCQGARECCQVPGRWFLSSFFLT